jgi:hypothetical protein
MNCTVEYKFTVAIHFARYIQNYFLLFHLNLINILGFLLKSIYSSIEVCGVLILTVHCKRVHFVLSIFLKYLLPSHLIFSNDLKLLRFDFVKYCRLTILLCFKIFTILRGTVTYNYSM